MKNTLRFESLAYNSGNGNSHSETAGAVPLNVLSEVDLLPQTVFTHMLCLERKRTERSRRPFVLMLLESGKLLRDAHKNGALGQVLKALSRSTRETDIRGWYQDGSVIGVIFTELGATMDSNNVASALLAKVTNALSCSLSIEQINTINLSFHVFPEDWDHDGTERLSDSILYPDLPPRKGMARSVKRAIDIVGSLLALIVFFPLLIGISVLIKLTSRGPVLFRGQRLGQYGKSFTFLKFRSMHVNNDHTIHQDFVKNFIAGKNGNDRQAGQEALYKMTADPRITPLGRMLRKTSLDELPQFLNVLKGDMSLVGPRPPIPYEFDCYDLWHKGRLLAVKPGITGLWQIEGRSRVTFDEMVRMDLRYARSWSVWMDLKILFNTPRAVLTAHGAY